MSTLLILAKPAQIMQETSHIEFDVHFPPQLNLGNVKNSLDVEGPHHYNIFSESVQMTWKAIGGISDVQINVVLHDILREGENSFKRKDI